MFLTPRRALSRLYHGRLPKKINQDHSFIFSCALQSKYRVFHINWTDRSYDLAMAVFLSADMSQRANVVDCAYL